MTEIKQGCPGGVLIRVHRPKWPLFGLGAVYCVPAVGAHLAAYGRTPAELLAYHAAGEWGEVGDEDAAANDRAVEEGGQLRSCHRVEGRKVWLVTGPADKSGVRIATCILFAEE